MTATVCASAQMREIGALVAAELAGGFAVELVARAEFWPVDLYPSGARSRVREEITVLGERVDDAWDIDVSAALAAAVRLAGGVRDPDPPPPATSSSGGGGSPSWAAPAGSQSSRPPRRRRVVGLPPSPSEAATAAAPVARAAPAGAVVEPRTAAPAGYRTMGCGHG